MMSRSVKKEQQTSFGQGPGGPSESGGHTSTSTDCNIMRMSESEYRQLQQILYSHMEGPPNQGPIAAKLKPVFFSCSFPQYQAVNITGQCGTSGTRCGHDQSESWGLGVMVPSEKTLCNPNRRSSGAVLGHQAANKENEMMGLASVGSSKSAVRVSLEERFDGIASDGPQGQGPQESDPPGRRLMTLICQVQRAPGAQGKCAAIGNPTAAPGCRLVLPADSGSSQAQAKTSGSSCPLLEATRHQEISLPRAVSLCYQQGAEPANQTPRSSSRTSPEQGCVKVGDASCRRRPGKRSHAQKAEPRAERRALRDLQAVGDACDPGGAPEATSWLPTHPRASEPELSGQQGGLSQRREKHNRMERDRRRRIRVSCDELNLLVPFCDGDTDKATTLQWTAAFLRYLRGKHGDSLKAVSRGHTGC
eukprot:XP_002943245.2 PREDICTED: transcription factor-like 5 protein [Xenopus tropicalis]